MRQEIKRNNRPLIGDTSIVAIRPTRMGSDIQLTDRGGLDVRLCVLRLRARIFSLILGGVRFFLRPIVSYAQKSVYPIGIAYDSTLY